VEVFKGNTADPATVAAQVAKLKERFGIERVAWAGDRGMLTCARIEQVLKPQGMDWVSSLRAPQIAQLAAEHGPFQPSLFDERNLLELTSQHFPEERLVVCRNPLLAEERARRRLELLAATEADLSKIVMATQRARNPLRGKEAIALRVGRVIERFHMAKHIELTITETSLGWTRKAEAIAAETALDGLYVIRTSLSKQQLDASATVAAYKSLAHVERAFRSMKTVELNVRPVFHYNEQRVRAHVFLCMLAYYVEWHMRQRLKPLLFDDEHLDEASASRASPVLKAVRSEHAKAKDASKLADDGLPLHSFRTLLKDLGTLSLNITHTALNPEAKFVLTTRPTPLQAKAFQLLGLNPPVPSSRTPWIAKDQCGCGLTLWSGPKFGLGGGGGVRGSRGGIGPSDRAGRLGRLRPLGVGAVGVCSRLTVQHREDQHHDGPDQRDQVDQEPPAAAADVVQPAHAHRQRRQQRAEHEDRRQHARALAAEGQAGDVVEHRQHDQDQQVDEDEHPVLAPRRSACELGVFLQYVDELVHRRLRGLLPRLESNRGRRSRPARRRAGSS
jgi:hypothetical protein